LDWVKSDTVGNLNGQLFKLIIRHFRQLSCTYSLIGYYADTVKRDTEGNPFEATVWAPEKRYFSENFAGMFGYLFGWRLF